jgi:hypothetical protein
VSTRHPGPGRDDGWTMGGASKYAESIRALFNPRRKLRLGRGQRRWGPALNLKLEDLQLFSMLLEVSSAPWNNAREGTANETNR